MLRLLGAASLGVSALQEPSAALGDASQLVQATAQVHGGGLSDEASDPKPFQAFVDVANDMRRKWKEHRLRQMEELEPWKLKELRLQKSQHHGDRPKREAASKVKPLTEEERAALEKEAQRAKFGEPMTLLVRDSMGRELPISFRSGARLQVLMHSVCRKLGIELGQANFTHRERALEPLTTAQEFGLADQDVIEVDSPVLQAAKRRKEELQRKAAAVAQVRREEEEKQKEVDVKRNVRKEKKAREIAKVAEYQRKKQQLRKNDMLTLRFVSTAGGKEVNINVKRNNWLKGTMDLVCKRMGVDRDRTRFFKDYTREMKVIGEHDSARTLYLKDEAIITVKPPAK